jgi:Xaa-Pro dipeptidase
LSSAEVFAARREAVRKSLPNDGLLAVLDAEGSRTKDLRYLTGHAQDAVLLMDGSGREILVAWDQPLAQRSAPGLPVRALAEFDRLYAFVIKTIKKDWNLKGAVELGAHLSLEQFEEIAAGNPGSSFTSARVGHDKIRSLRAVKDTTEIEIYMKASHITDLAMDRAEALVAQGASELDLALELERFVRENGGEGCGFETLAAGPDRSFAIHPFPSYTALPFGTSGASILDFGLQFEGYTTDVTMTFLRRPVDEEVLENARLVEQAAALAVTLIGPGLPASRAAMAVNEFFAQKGKTMPHSLGHGVGLDAHEQPNLKPTSTAILAPGHIVTIEPGLYVLGKGGIRLEDDYLITETGALKLTHSRIVRL